jgi:hypothetical protein
MNTWVLPSVPLLYEKKLRKMKITFQSVATPPCLLCPCPGKRRIDFFLTPVRAHHSGLCKSVAHQRRALDAIKEGYFKMGWPSSEKSLLANAKPGLMLGPLLERTVVDFFKPRFALYSRMLS